MLDRLPPEILHRIILFSCPFISLSVTPFPPPTLRHKKPCSNGQDSVIPAETSNDCTSQLSHATCSKTQEDTVGEQEAEYGPNDARYVSEYFDTRPPTILARLARTCKRIYEEVRYIDGNAWLYAQVFERSMDFDAPRRRLGVLWAGPHGIAWEGRKRWAAIRRVRNAIRIWLRDGYRSTTWQAYYSESDLLADLWTFYFMLLENDGKNAVLITLGVRFTSFLEMMCAVFFGRAMIRRPGWPKETPERALLVWLLWAVDPSPDEFLDPELFHKTKSAMRAFVFASFRYSLGIFPPTYLHHPAALDPSKWSHQIPPTALLPYPLNPYTSSRYASWTPPLDAPVYQYSNDPLYAITIYARTIYIYQPSLAVGALLWYFGGAEDGTEHDPSLATRNRMMDSPTEEEDAVAEVHFASNTRNNQTQSSTSRTDSVGSSPRAGGVDEIDPSALTSKTLSLTQSTTTNNTSTTFSSFASLARFIPALRDHHGWTTPLLFAIPPEVQLDASAFLPQQRPPQPRLNKVFRNALWKRGFNVASRQLEQEWTRRLEGQMRFQGPGPGSGVGVPNGFIPGSLEGTWEGGFLFVEFEEYAQFLTGEREADTNFYNCTSDKLYGRNRQVWKLKEYELQTYPEPASHLSPSTSSNAPRSMSPGGRHNSPSFAAKFAASHPDTASHAAFLESNPPLSVGKWKDGWLPPAETLEWRFPDDGGDELEIIETVPLYGPTSLPQESTTYDATIPSNSGVANGALSSRSQSLDADGEWASEQAGLAGKVRGRVNQRTRPPNLLPTLSDASTATNGTIPTITPGSYVIEREASDMTTDVSVTPMGRNINLQPEGPLGNTSTLPLVVAARAPPSGADVDIARSSSSPPAHGATSSTPTSPLPLSPPSTATSPTSSPRSPDMRSSSGAGVKSRPFSWGWRSKSKKKDKRQSGGLLGFASSTSHRDKDTPSSGEEGDISFPVPPKVNGQEKPLPPVYGRDELPLQTNGELSVPMPIPVEEKTPRQQLRRDTLETAPDSILDNVRVSESVQEDAPLTLDDGNALPQQEVRSVQNVSKYVRWDPNVAWAKYAIWGPNPPVAIGSSSTSATGSMSHSSASTNIRGYQPQYAQSASVTGAGTDGMVNSVSTAASLPSIGTSVKAQRQVRDILIFGESFSAWGEATLRGRVRAHDGLITLVKNYPNRATWIYTGYVVGGENFVGRWRDANSPEEVNGYEGPFAMKRRR